MKMINVRTVLWTFIILIAIISVTDGAREGKCNGKCERGKKANAKCIQSGRPCNRSCLKQDEPCKKSSRQNYCQCDDGYVRQFRHDGKWDCVRPDECDQKTEDRAFS